MSTPEEVTIQPSTGLSRIYKTDPYGFPIYHFDEEDYVLSKKEQGPDPNAMSDVLKTESIESERTDTFESNLNM